MFKSIFKITAISIILFFSIASSQDCGDMNENGSVGISDLTYLFDYYFSDGPAPDPDVSDVDSRHGFTVADIWFFSENSQSMPYTGSCIRDKDYSFSLELRDTIFIGVNPTIPDTDNEVFIPIALKADSSEKAFYFPIYTSTASNSNIFNYSDYHTWFERTVMLDKAGEDTLIFVNLTHSIYDYTLQGVNLFVSLKYTRSSNDPGAEIMPEIVNRNDTLKYGLAYPVSSTDVDMIQPVIEYVDISYPFGDYNLDKELTISDLTGLVNLLFIQDIRYDPYESSFGVSNIDNNCDGTFGISDLTYFVDYLFGGGPAPCNPFAF